MIFRKIEIQNKSDLEFVEKLYIESFPINERRPLPKMIEFIKDNDLYNVYLILNNENDRVGFFTLWNFHDFLFLEHFAISNDFRNKGYGKLVLDTIINQSQDKPIVGEIELHEASDYAARRKSFYERIGFKIWDIPYKQPAYDEGLYSIPMLLISYGQIDLETKIEEVRQTLYTIVYSTKL